MNTLSIPWGKGITYGDSTSYQDSAVLRILDYLYCICVFQVVSLEQFRSLQDKLCLLDISVSAHDGNVITAVTLFKL